MAYETVDLGEAANFVRHDREDGEFLKIQEGDSGKEDIGRYTIRLRLIDSNQKLSDWLTITLNILAHSYDDGHLDGIGLLFKELLIRRERLGLNALYDGKLDSDVPVPPTAKIKSISSDGVMEILFSNPMVVHPELLNLTSNGLLIADHLRED